MNKEQLFKNRLMDLAHRSYDRCIVTFTDFMDLNELHTINNLNLKESGAACRLFGGYTTSERQIAAFIPDALSYDWEYPITCLEIKPLAAKFSDPLTHRDYLGALLHLGIERSVIGDILIKGTSAYIFCLDRMSAFITEELTRVRHTQVSVKPVDAVDETIKPEYEVITGTVASVRLDTLIALAFKTSRSSMLGLIEGGKVFVNGKLITSNGYHPKAGDIISVRGSGKFQYDAEVSTTKKGRISIRINRYR